MEKLINSNSSTVYFLKNGIIKKVYNNKKKQEIMESEILCLKKLKAYDIVPKLLKIDYKNQIIYLENVGERISPENLPKNWKFQLNKILTILQKEGIQHRDLKLEEILVKKDKIKIVDFGASRVFNKKKKFDLYDRYKSRFSNDSFIINLINFFLNQDNNKGEMHVIVVWGNKDKTQELISILPKNIKIVFSYYYAKNFFGKFLNRRVAFLKKFYSNRELFHGNKGKKGFFAYILFDKKPQYELRRNQFSKETAKVNKNLFDIKNKIRRGRLGYIHASDNLTESFDNIAALTPTWGKYPMDLWNHTKPFFKSFQDFFKILNMEKKLKYVVLRGFDPNKMHFDGTDIDILVNDPYLFERITKAKYYKHLNEKKSYYASSINNGGYKAAAKISIGKKIIKFDIRRVGDNYFYDKWQKNMLKNYFLKNNVKVLNDTDKFYSYIYHEIIHKGNFRKSTLVKLRFLVSKLKLKKHYGYDDKSIFIKLLNNFMKESSYKFVCADELALGCGSKCLKKINKIPHLNDIVKALKHFNWPILKDLSLRSIKNNFKYNFFFYILYYISRIVLYSRHYRVIKFKFIIIYTWLNIKNLFIK